MTMYCCIGLSPWLSAALWHQCRPLVYLLVLVLLQVSWRHQTLRVDVGGDGLYDLRIRIHVLHLQEGQDVLDL